MSVIHAFELLAQDTCAPSDVMVAVGDDRFLKKLVITHLTQACMGEDEDATLLEGTQAQWRDVRDAVATRSLFGSGPRFVMLRSADDFVSRYRSELESLVQEGPAGGRLLLDVKALPSNTKLYKHINERGLLVDCKPPQVKRGRSTQIDHDRLESWLKQWAQSTHQVRLEDTAAGELLQLVGPELGLLDQELAKLALFVEAGGSITADQVRQVVGGWRAKTSWELLEAALDGNAAEALKQLERLLQAGEAPQMIAGAMLWSLRRFADAAQRVLEAEQSGRRITLPVALEQAGIKKWPQGALQRAERQLRQLGRGRASVLYEQLLQLDLSLKSSHAAPQRARWALEKTILSLARDAA